MPTVNAISRNMYSMFKLSQTNSTFKNVNRSLSNTQNFFNTSLNTTSNKNNFLFSSDSLTQLQDVISKRLTQAQDTIKKLDEYTNTSKKFYTGFFTETDALKDSAASLSKTNFSSGKTEDIVGAVKQFAADYNSTATFLQDNASLSTRAGSLATSFSSAKYTANTLAAIGVNVDEVGTLSVDETKLTAALSEDADQVGAILGRRGLAGQTTAKVNAAVRNSTNLIPFPDIAGRSKNNISQGMLLDLFV